MPVYRFICMSCQSVQRKYLMPENRDNAPLCKCGKQTVRSMGIPDGIAMETADEYKGKTFFQDNDRKIGERADEHYDKVELPRIIQSIGKENAIAAGMIDEDGKSRH